ncbi:MAG TPA: hypothetical protein VML35_03620 [Gaiellaceae bacterium]|nr:hypothetical protein [Gaiellaceae bacterium]
MVRKRTQVWALGATCLVIGAMLGPTLATAANDKLLGVFVANTDTNPVPTKAIGSTQVNGTVAISGTPTVSLATTPFATTIFAEFAGSSFDSTSFTVPDGKRLRLEFFSFQEINFIGRGVRSLHLVVTSGGQRVRHFLPGPDDSDNDTNIVTQQLSIVADPGSEVTLDVFLEGPLGSDSAVFGMPAAFAGTLTDV